MGFAECDAEDEDGRLVARGAHVKFLHMGPAWDLAFGRLLPFTQARPGIEDIAVAERAARRAGAPPAPGWLPGVLALDCRPVPLPDRVTDPRFAWASGEAAALGHMEQAPPHETRGCGGGLMEAGRAQGFMCHIVRVHDAHTALRGMERRQGAP
eukprot:gene40713-16944_t